MPRTVTLQTVQEELAASISTLTRLQRSVEALVQSQTPPAPEERLTAAEWEARRAAPSEPFAVELNETDTSDQATVESDQDSPKSTARSRRASTTQETTSTQDSNT